MTMRWLLGMKNEDLQEMVVRRRGIGAVEQGGVWGLQAAFAIRHSSQHRKLVTDFLRWGRQKRGSCPSPPDMAAGNVPRQLIPLLGRALLLASLTTALPTIWIGERKIPNNARSRIADIVTLARHLLELQVVSLTKARNHDPGIAEYRSPVFKVGQLFSTLHSRLAQPHHSLRSAQNLVNLHQGQDPATSIRTTTRDR